MNAQARMRDSHFADLQKEYEMRAILGESQVQLAREILKEPYQAEPHKVQESIDIKQYA